MIDSFKKEKLARSDEGSVRCNRCTR